MSANDELRDQLRRWGYMTVNRYASTWERSSTGDSVLALAKDLAPGTRENAARRLAGRDGGERRRFMAAKASIQRCGGCGFDVGPHEQECAQCGMVPTGPRLSLRTLPMWAVDPVRATNDAARPHDHHAVIDLGIPDDLRWIESAIASLSRSAPLRAMVLREEFCGTGTQRMKTARVERQYGGRLSVRQYRYELQLALEWMRAKQAA